MEPPNQARLGEVTHTARGFELIEFKDWYGVGCSLQQSSAFEDSPDSPDSSDPGTSAVWLGAGEDRMHLKREQVCALIAHLQTWLDQGKFLPKQKTNKKKKVKD